MELEPSDLLRELREVAVAGVIRDIDGDSTGRETYSGEDMKASRCGEPSYTRYVDSLLDVGQASKRRNKLRARTAGIMEIHGILHVGFFAGVGIRTLCPVMRLPT
ncbi:Uncharacterized protein Adt_21329 [Abeliophyllum distichum]|uniref:Uncharacterized protein n=1 Tax=Abeliophyllum distichum TaxID=126358 RepID=A0ABD1SZ58_9LAMI